MTKLSEKQADAAHTRKLKICNVFRDAAASWERLSQADVGKRLGVSQQRISDLLKAKHLHRFSLDMLLSLADRADIPVQLLVGGAALEYQAALQKKAAKRKGPAREQLLILFPPPQLL